jgi:hypothetical protein
MNKTSNKSLDLNKKSKSYKIKALNIKVIVKGYKKEYLCYRVRKRPNRLSLKEINK